MLKSLLRFGLVLAALGLAAPTTAAVRLVESGAHGLQLVVYVEAGIGPGATRVTAPGLPRGAGPGGVDLPFVAELIAVPPGARPVLRVRSEAHVEVGDVQLARADSTASVLPALEGTRRLGRLEPLGILRGVPAYSLQLYPWQPAADGSHLRVHTRLRVDIEFVGGAARGAATGVDPHGEALRGAFLNPPVGDWTIPAAAARPTAGADWYDPAQPWMKIFVSADGVYRITRAWMVFFNVRPGDLDPRTFRLFHAGVEQPLLVRGEADGGFDADDELLFYGRYRRALSVTGERDHESEYGPTETYWLTWDGASGRRFEPRDAAPVSGFPVREWYEHRTHHEVDRSFDQLTSAPDTLADRWFYQQERPLKVPYPDRPSAQTFVGDITGLYDDEEYEARVTVAIQGKTGAGLGEHHTIVQFNNHVLEEAYWSGQVSRVIDAAVPSSWLRDRNRIILQGIADRIREDWIWFNWFRVDYRRRFHAYPGFVAAPTEAAPAGHRIRIEGFKDPGIILLDVANGVRLDGAEVVLEDSLYSAAFEDAPLTPPVYVGVDSLSLRTPSGAADTPSDWRRAGHGADYVLLAHPDFLAAAERLGQHRRDTGLQVAVVSSEDVFDEFSYGRFDRQAIADFTDHVYHEWQPRPACLLILGDATWDYRGIYTGDRQQTLVPTQYYLARGRGYSPSDYHFALVDGDDLLADLSIGRLAVDAVAEAEAVVDKIIAYDLEPEPGGWRGRSLYAANWHAINEFSASLDSMAARYTEPLGLESVRIYAADNAPLPSSTGKAFLDALNDGALIANFSGHGSAGNLQFLFSTQFPDWEYLQQVRNGRRLPLMLALSCLNGLFTDPRTEGLSELLTEKADGGAIAYISATALSFTSQNALLADGIYRQLFAEERLQFGPVLDAAKARMLAAHSSWVDDPQTMQLQGDPAQRLALPTAADYAAEALTIGDTPVTRGATVRVSGRWRNLARRGRDSLAVVVLGQGADGSVDTLHAEWHRSFAGRDSLAFDWAVGERRGPYRLALLVDADDRAGELDEGDNRLEVQLNILEAEAASPLLPPAGGEIDDWTLAALTPVDAHGISSAAAVEFALSTDPGFSDSSTVTAAATVTAGRAEHTFAAAPAATSDAAPLFWRVRIVDGGVAGPWSASRSFRHVTDAGSDSMWTAWRHAGRQLVPSASAELRLATNDDVVLADGHPLFRPAKPTRDDGFTVLDLPGAGVLATDGAYLYAKRWYNDASSIYNGTDFFARIGTGFGGTYRGRYYGVLADSTTAGISATYHSDGYLYSDSGHCFELERIDPVTGRLDTVRVPDGLLDWKTGQVVDDKERRPGQTLHALITSDGRHVYNVSMSSALGTRVGWGVRVFDPADDWRLLREFVSPPTETGFTYLWTDGIFADGERLYFIEYGGQRRIRAVRATDGAFLEEWTSDQDVTRVITGQFDWTNDRVWLGDLWGSGLFRYRRDGARQPVRLVAGPVGPARAWGEVGIDAEGVRLTLEGKADSGWVALPGLASVSGDRVDLAGVDATRFPRLRLAATLDTSAGTRLTALRLGYAPVSDLEIAAAEHAEQTVWATVRNRGPVAAEAAALQLETAARVVAVLPVPALPPGSLFAARFDSLPTLPHTVRVRVLPAGADGDPANDLFVLEDAGGPRLTFRAWPSAQPLHSGDRLRGDQALLIEARGQGQLAVAVDGEPAAADSAWATERGPQALYRLTAGPHRVQAHLVGTAGELAVARLDVEVSDRLAVANLLVHPNPVRDETAFTFYLSGAADVVVDVYGLSGRRARRLGPHPFAEGFGQLPWDGRDDGGARLAAGSYLFVLTARGPDGESVRRRAPLAVIR